MKSSQSSDDSGSSNHQKPPSLAEILQPRLLHSHSSSPSASTSRDPSPIQVERPSLPKPIHPDFNLPHRLHSSSTVFPNVHASALILSPAAQARRKDALDPYPGNQTYKEMLGQIMARSHAISSFADAYRRIAMKQNTARVNPATLPKEQVVNEMLRNQEILKQLLQQVNSLQCSLRGQSGPGPPPQHMTESQICPAFFSRDVAIAPDSLLACRDTDYKEGRLYAEIAILSKQSRELNKALGVIGLYEA
ncbi:gata zinc finger 10 [Fusarium sp. NRRL 52700]|nr:gata zinc finger 10 [Fusarium sp. NRRL 52700]